MSSSRDQGGDKHLISSQLPNMKTELQSDEHSSSLTPAQAVQYNVQTLSGSNGPYPQTTGTEASLSPTTYSLPSIPLSPSPSPFTVSSPVPILQQQQQQQNAYSVPESMGPEALGDFAYINNFPEQSVNGTNNNYELQAYPDSFQQTREVRHLNQAFTPQSPAPQPQPQPYLQHQQYQPQPQPQTPYPHPPTIALGAFPEQFNQQSLPPYAGPELVNTAHNEVNAGPSAIPSRSYPALSSPSLSKPIRRRKKSFWIGVAIIGTLIKSKQTK
ncbi:hypothetical protein FBU30_002911 [Linnemannia zychae]|nr:hypothetical protein FBU30_002911 [Linnemannia zychae]